MSVDHVGKTIQVYNSIAAQYAVQAEAHAPIVERDAFCELMTKGGFILDVGCGSGRDCAYFETKGFEVVGVDLSESLLTIAKKVAFNSEFYKQDVRKLSFADASFDGIWACAVLIHLKRSEITPVLSSFFRILKPGGVLMILVKAGTKDEFVSAPSVPDKARYFCYFSKKEMQDFIENAGFQTVNIYTYNEAERFTDGYPTDWIACFARKPLL